MSKSQVFQQLLSLNPLMLKLKFQYFGLLMRRVDSLEKTDAGRDWGQEEKGTTEDEMAGWHHWLEGHESQWILEVGDGQGGLACCDSWGRKESDTTEQLNWTELNWILWQSCQKSLYFIIRSSVFMLKFLILRVNYKQHTNVVENDMP